MTGFLTGCLVVFSILVQSTIFNRVTLFGASPDLVLILTVLFGFLRGSRLGAWVGFGGGILQDILSGQFIGANALTKMAVGYLAGLMEGKFFSDNPVTPMLLLFVGTIGNEILFWLILASFGRSIPLYVAALRLIFPVAVLNSVLAPFIFSQLRKLDRFFKDLD